MDDYEYLNFLLEEEFCIKNQENIYQKKKAQERELEKQLKKKLKINKTCGKYFKLFAIGYTREEIAKKLKADIKTVEKFFDLWVF